MNIITEFSTSSAFTANSGIDQGEVVLPLIWQIFYDPLLARINRDKEAGYKMEQIEPRNYLHRPFQTCQQIGGMAYADNMTWISNSRDNIQRTLDIANEFYALNNITINRDKSELIVINSSQPSSTTNYVTIGKNNAVVHANDTRSPSRYLGIYLTARSGNNHTYKIMEQEMQQIYNEIKFKKLTAAQTIYVNNIVLIPRLEY
jgi:hypothetical protein